MPDSKRLIKAFKKAASSPSEKIHVVRSKNGWAVKKEGSIRASSITKNKSDALKNARNMKSGKFIVVHKRDGTISKFSKKTK